MQFELNKDWKTVLSKEIAQPYFKELLAFLVNEYKSKRIFPPKELVFNAFNYCPFNQVKVVIIGQDPYHGLGQANGLSFSVNDGMKFPPSLVNIFKALENDLDEPIPISGNLERWAKQGVLMLNATLTVEEAKAGSHQGKGWEQFTDKVIELISEQTTNTVFMLWGAFAQQKTSLIDEEKHLVLKAVHPSPLSAYRGFLTCKHFSKANAYLKQHQTSTIDW